MLALILLSIGLVLAVFVGSLLYQLDRAAKAGHRMMWGDGPRRPELLQSSLIPGDPFKHDTACPVDCPVKVYAGGAR